MESNVTAPKKTGVFDLQANARVLIRIVVLLVVLVGGLWLWISFKGGTKTANAALAIVTRQPIEIKNSVENIRANSRWWLPITTPYAGTLNVELTVLKGNELDVMVVPATELSNLQANHPLKQMVVGFDAAKTRNFKRAQRIPQGSYYLVMIDTTLGVLSAKSSDVQIHARFEP